MAPIAGQYYTLPIEIMNTRQQTASTFEMDRCAQNINRCNKYSDFNIVLALLKHPDIAQHVQLLQSMFDRNYFNGKEHRSPILCAWMRIALPKHGCRIRGDKFGENGCQYADSTEFEFECRKLRSQTRPISDFQKTNELPALENFSLKQLEDNDLMEVFEDELFQEQNEKQKPEQEQLEDNDFIAVFDEFEEQANFEWLSDFEDGDFNMEEADERQSSSA